MRISDWSSDVCSSDLANGVILIETKDGKGINGKPQFNVELDYGLSNQLKPLATYGPEGYIQRLLDIRSMMGEEADPTKIAIYLSPEEQKTYEATPDPTPTTPRTPISLLVPPASNRQATYLVYTKINQKGYK